MSIFRKQPDADARYLDDLRNDISAAIAKRATLNPSRGD